MTKLAYNLYVDTNLAVRVYSWNDLKYFEQERRQIVFRSKTWIDEC